MFSRQTIRKRVMATIEQKILEEEKKFQDECIRIDQEAEVAKQKASDKAVDNLIGKII